MRYRDPWNYKKRKKTLKPTFKSTWTVEKLLDVLIADCNESLKTKDRFEFCAEDLSKKHRAKIEIVRAAIQKFRLNIPEGYFISEHNSAPHESSRHKFFWHGPGLGGWCATWYAVNKRYIEEITDE
jgi:hypothetical protein